MYTFCTSHHTLAGTVWLQVFCRGVLVAETTALEREAESAATRIAEQHASTGRIARALS
jgi:hypothetical protein